MPLVYSFRSLARSIAVLGALAVLALPQLAQAQPTPIKIAVVNLDFVAANSKAGKELQAKLDAFRQEVASQSQTRTAAAREIRQRIAEGVNTLSEARLLELQKEYEDAQIAIKRYQDDKQREGQKMQEEGLRKIEQEMEPVFEAIRNEEGYDLILNNVPGVVIMAGDRVDITQKVVDRLAATPGG